MESNKCFFGGTVPLARYDVSTHPIFLKLIDQQTGYFWRPGEINLTSEKAHFDQLTPAEQHIFTANLKRQILLDTVQGRAPSIALLPIVSIPELETWISTWVYFETIHARSYQHILQNVYSDPTSIIDGLLDIPEILECRDDITKYYDRLIRFNEHVSLNGYDATMTEYEHKKALWLCLMSINVLEGIRFYASFACSWAFAEQKKVMEGNAKIIKLIARDENLHLASVQHLFKILPKEDPDFILIAEETREESTRIFEQAVDQERRWAKYLFQHGSMIGLNYDMLVDYVEWRAAKLMPLAGLQSPYKGGACPLPWTLHWISGGQVQVAPQDTEISSYIVGDVNLDVKPGMFSGIKLKR